MKGFPSPLRLETDPPKRKAEVRSQDLPSQELKNLGVEIRDSFLQSGKYENFHNMNLYAATPSEALDFFRVDESKRLLGKMGIDVSANVSPKKVLEMARTKDVFQEASISASEMYRDWAEDRKKNPKNYRASYAGVGGATRKKDDKGNLIEIKKD